MAFQSGAFQSNAFQGAGSRGGPAGGASEGPREIPLGDLFAIEALLEQQRHEAAIAAQNADDEEAITVILLALYGR